QNERPGGNRTIAHHKRVRVAEGCFAVDQLPAVCGDQIRVFLMAQLADELVLLCNKPRPVDRNGLGPNPLKSVMACLPEQLTCAKLRFRWNAADIDAGTAEGAAFDHHHASATLAGGDCCREGASARADDCHVESLG